MVVCPTHKKYNLFDFHLGNIHALWGQRALFFRKQAIFDTKKKIAGIAKATLRRSASEMPKCQSVFPFSLFSPVSHNQPLLRQTSESCFIHQGGHPNEVLQGRVAPIDSGTSCHHPWPHKAGEPNKGPAEEERSIININMEVPPLPISQRSWRAHPGPSEAWRGVAVGGQHPGRRSPGGDGGEEENTWFFFFDFHFLDLCISQRWL